ncbi:hypothetical protein FOMG_00568 [Fusarium oxysporum f. sp. melonis 26406]|uniref:Uncharacterized protein n=1 Tax=Fusarium oxysporum f. sp. melonis 26406 TaxID=1089452 RepID=X0BPY0_FUSOX|nr:hypothetical protein FOMG_00568 [Fusarium oxysporum f. sp. melonis 26406]
MYPRIEEKGFDWGARRTVATEPDESEMKLPEPEFRDLLDDWYSGNAQDNDEDDESEAEDEATSFETSSGGSSQKFDFHKVLDQVPGMDLDDLQAHAVINDGLLAHEIESLRITLRHKESIFSWLPDNQASIDVMEANPNIRDAVGTFRLRLKQLLDNLASFALAIEHPKDCPALMKIFAMFSLANSTQECRDRLLEDIFANPSITPIFVQYLLGQEDWTVESFDELSPKLNFDKSNHFLTSYSGVAHSTDGNHYLCCQHEILQRRSEGDHSCLYIHDKMALSGESWFFIPLFRFPTQLDDSTALQKSALALLGEIIAIIFLGTGKRNPITRRGKWQSLANRSQEILVRLRPGGFPDPPWQGSNLLLPILQSPSPLWNLLSGRLVREVEQTKELMGSLEDHFLRTHQPWLSRDTCRRILEANQQSTGDSSNKTLKLFYSQILERYNVKYEILHQLYLKKLSILWVAIIAQLEDLGKVTFSDTTQRYSFSDEHLDWDKISHRALEESPKELRKNYTPRECLHLYHDHHSRYFNQQVLNKPNWEYLRGGLPVSFASKRPGARYPRPIRSRILSICRYFIYHLVIADHGVDAKDELLKLPVESRAEVKGLLGSVIDRLREDVAIDSAIEVTPGAWEDESLQSSILYRLYASFHEYRNGVSQARSLEYKDLEELDANWADPWPAPEPHQDTVQRTPLKPSLTCTDQHEIKKNLTKLMECYEVPESAPLSPLVGDSEAEDTTVESSNLPDDQDKAFQLFAVDGLSTRGQLFSISSKHIRLRKAKVPSGTTKEWISNACPCVGANAVHATTWSSRVTAKAKLHAKSARPKRFLVKG